MEYRIISKKNENELEREINEMLRKGWKPQGGLVVVDAPDSWIYWQAVIREDW